MTEADLAARVVRHLKKEGWEVYQEVQAPRGRTRVDIYAVRTVGGVRRTRAIEVKRHFNLVVMAQADKWRRFAHEVYVATPRPKTSRAFAHKVCKTFGIGVVEVQSRKVTEPVAGDVVEPIAYPALHAEQKKKGVAGSKDTYYTPYRHTREQLVAVAQADPGIPLKDAVAAVSHHYADDWTAVRTLRSFAKMGRLTGLRVDRYGRLYTT